jgi:hypothetical protein
MSHKQHEEYMEHVKEAKEEKNHDKKWYVSKKLSASQSVFPKKFHRYSALAELAKIKKHK